MNVDRHSIGTMIAMAAAAFLSACSSSKESAPSHDELVLNVPTERMAISMSATVEPGKEMHRCRFIKVDPVYAGLIAAMSHEYTPGSHHLVLYSTDLKEIPQGMEGDVDCFAQGVEVMVHARGVVYGSQTPKGAVRMPDDVGLPIGAGDVLLLQSHYLNPGRSPLSARMDIKLDVTTAEHAHTRAGSLIFYDPFIVVPAGGRASAQMRCALSGDVKLVSVLAHTHKRGTGFNAYLDGADGSMTDTPFYTSKEWDNPVALGKTLEIKAGSRIRFRCDYENLEGTADVFQGQSADINEMCAFNGIYYPALSHEDEICSNVDVLGAGTRSCKQTLDCVQQCPEGSRPTFADGVPDVHPCWQQCLASSCTTAAAPFMGALDCIQQNCNGECVGESSGDCLKCVVNHCADAYGACGKHKCDQ